MAQHHIDPVRAGSIAHDDAVADRPVATHLHDYTPPQLARLGTLAELTLGGDSGPDDGLGAAGDEGSV